MGVAALWGSAPSIVSHTCQPFAAVKVTAMQCMCGMRVRKGALWADSWTGALVKEGTVGAAQGYTTSTAL
jgi:hypothetical protein